MNKNVGERTIFAITFAILRVFVSFLCVKAAYEISEIRA